MNRYNFKKNLTWKNNSIPTAMTTPTESPKLKIHKLRLIRPNCTVAK